MLPALMVAALLSGSPLAARAQVTNEAQTAPSADGKPAPDAAPGTGPAGAPALDAAATPTVTATENGREARITLGDCTAALEYRPAQSAAQYRDNCRRPIAEKLTAMMDLLGAALADVPEPERAASPGRIVILAGRIVQTFPDMAAELVAGAAGASAWDADAARRSAAFANAGVVRLLTRTEGGTAIRTAKAPPGYVVTGIAVDKVLTARPQRLPFPLPPHVVSANSETALPFDALLWIALARQDTVPPGAVPSAPDPAPAPDLSPATSPAPSNSPAPSSSPPPASGPAPAATQQ